MDFGLPRPLPALAAWAQAEAISKIFKDIPCTEHRHMTPLIVQYYLIKEKTICIYKLFTVSAVYVHTGCTGLYIIIITYIRYIYILYAYYAYLSKPLAQNLPGVWLSRPKLGGLNAMGSFDLEPHLTALGNEDRISLVFDIVLFSNTKTLCKTRVHNQLFALDHVMSDVQSTVTVLNGKICHTNYGVSVTWDETTRWIIHPTQHMSGLFRIIEACSGIGAMGKGFEMTGAEVQCYIDTNPEYCRWLRDHSKTPVIQGDICDPETIFAINKHVSQPHTLTGGFACQPFSSLGDQREEKDPRSTSFWGMLEAGFRLQSLMIVLECTKEAACTGWPP